MVTFQWVVPEEESVAALCDLNTPPLSLTPQLLAMITSLTSLTPPSGGGLLVNTQLYNWQRLS